MHIVEPYNANKQPKFNFVKNGKDRHAYMYVRAKSRPSRSAWQEHCKCMVSYTNIWGNFKGSAELDYLII